MYTYTAMPITRIHSPEAVLTGGAPRELHLRFTIHLAFTAQGLTVGTYLSLHL